MEPGSLEHFLSLYHDRHFGALLLSRLLEQYQSFRSLLDRNAHALELDGLEKKQLAALFADEYDERCLDCARQDIEWSQHQNNHLMWIDGDNYPSLLKEIATPPPLLFVRGSLASLEKPGLAIVGSRNCSDYGRHTAYWFAAELAAYELTIVSGLAIGIDTQAHRGALNEGARTIAILGNGIDLCYPRRNAGLACEISEQGALVSEFARGQGPRAHQFPRRNRIISGLSAAVLIVEANERSGSLITARLALEQNREVLAVPGPITSSRSRGCHRFIKQGATLVESPEEVITALLDAGTLVLPRQEIIETTADTASGKMTLDDSLASILNAVSPSGSLPDSLVSQSGLPWPQLNSALVELEMRGYVQRRDGRFYPSGDSLHRPRD